MQVLTMENIHELRGAPVVDAQGDKIGTVEQIYFDVRTDQPQWIALKTGIFGGRLTFVPLEGVNIEGNTLKVPFAKEHVEGSPDVYPDAISPHLEKALVGHYQMSMQAYGQGTTPTDESGFRLRRWDWETRR
jgi:sporulation protein YlmC with PRC-barrel domain